MAGSRRRFASVLLVALSAAAIVRTAPAQAQFRVASVVVYIPSGIGGGYDAYARLVSRHLGRYLPGNPALVPRNMPGAGGVVLANYFASVAPRDGSALALFMAGAPFEPLFGNALAKFDPQAFNWIMSLNRLINIGILWHEAPIRTAEEFVTREVTVGSSGGDSSTEVFPNVINRLAGTRFKVVTGYKGNGDVMLAMERNEVHGIVGTELSSLRATKPDWIRDGKARILLQIGLTAAADLPGVTMATDLIKDADSRQVFELLLARQEYGRPFALPPGTAPEVVTMFRQAFTAMIKDEAFRNDAAKMRADIIPGSGEEVASLFAKTYATPKPLVERAIALFRGADRH